MKWRVSYQVSVEITYEIEAPDENTAIDKARRDGVVINESEDDCELTHVEQIEERQSVLQSKK